MAVKISIIVPVYNTADYLRQAVESVLNQTLKDFEISCRDDGSTDGSAEIVAGYEKRDSRIKLISQSNQGSGTARNAGIKAASGE